MRHILYSRSTRVPTRSSWGDERWDLPHSTHTHTHTHTAARTPMAFLTAHCPTLAPSGSAFFIAAAPACVALLAAACTRGSLLAAVVTRPTVHAACAAINIHQHPPPPTSASRLSLPNIRRAPSCVFRLLRHRSYCRCKVPVCGRLGQSLSIRDPCSFPALTSGAKRRSSLWHAPWRLGWARSPWHPADRPDCTCRARAPPPVSSERRGARSAHSDRRDDRHTHPPAERRLQRVAGGHFAGCAFALRCGGGAAMPHIRPTPQERPQPTHSRRAAARKVAPQPATLR